MLSRAQQHNSLVRTGLGRTLLMEASGCWRQSMQELPSMEYQGGKTPQRVRYSSLRHLCRDILL